VRPYILGGPRCKGEGSTKLGRGKATVIPFHNYATTFTLPRDNVGASERVAETGEDIVIGNAACQSQE
jgi:hypothetical protein